MSTLAFTDGVRSAAVTSGTPGVTTQDFTVGSTSEVPKAAYIFVTRATTNDTLQADFMNSDGVTDGSFQGGIGNSYITSVGMTVITVAKSVCYNDAIIKLPLRDASGYAAVGAFDSFIAGGIRIRWDTIPTDAYLVHVVLFFGSLVQASAGTFTPPATGGGTSQVTTGFEPNHILTLSCIASATGSSFLANANSQIAHTIRTTGTSVRTRLMTHQYIDNVSVTSGTVYMTDASVAANYAGGTLPITPTVSTQVTAMHASDGFVVQSSGSGTGPLVVYLALKHGSQPVELISYQSPTSTGTVNKAAGFLVQSGLSLQTLATDSTWNTAAVNATTGYRGSGYVGPGGAFTTGNRAVDNVTSGLVDSYSDTKLISSWQGLTSPGRANRANASFHVSDGIDLDYTDVTANGRQTALFMLGAQDVFQATGSGSFPLATADGQGRVPFEGTGSGSFPLATATGVASLTFQGAGAGAFALPLGSGASLLVFQGTGAGTLPLATASGAAIIAFQGTGAGSLPLPTADGAALLAFTGAGAGAFALPLADGAALLVFTGTGSGSFPLATGAGASNLAFRGTGSGTFPLAQATGAANLIFQATSVASFPLATADGVSLLVFQGAGVGFFPLPTARGTTPAGPNLGCQAEMEGDYDRTSLLLGNYNVAKILTADYKTVTDFQGDNC